MKRIRKDPWETARRLLLYLTLFLSVEGFFLYWEPIWNRISANPDTSYPFLLVWICFIVFLWRPEDAGAEQTDR